LAGALFATLLLAGMDMPIQGTVRHFTIVLDDSVSMQAGGADSSAERARRLLLDWIGARDRYTIVAAGVAPRILAGPFADRAEVERALAQWRPEDVACDPEAAANLAGKFVSGDERILFLSDRADAGQGAGDPFERGATGKPLANDAIVFADRMRLAPGKDKAIVALQRFAGDAGAVDLTAMAGGSEIFRRRVELEPGTPVDLAFETSAVDAPIELRIGDDPLAADNAASLDPVPIKPVKAALSGLGDVAPFFMRALQAVPYTTVVDPADHPDLLFTTAPPAADAGSTATAAARGPWRTFYLPDPADFQTSASLAQGADILTDGRSPLVENLSFEGALWPFAAEKAELLAEPQIAFRGVPLLYQLGDSPGRRRYRLNLLVDRTNHFRQATWPTFIQDAVEECRLSMPGLGQSNFRQGEPVPLHLEADPALPPEFALLRDGRPMAAWDALPPELSDLPAGRYEVRQGEKSLAGFAVNLSSPGESDLQAADSRRPDLAGLAPAELRRTQSSPLVYYALLLAMLALAGMSWHFQDTSR
jgi:hypothetical protein